MTLSTTFTRRFGVQHPLIQAGMGEATDRLAAAVSNAGGLGSVGTIGKTLDQVREQVRATRAATNRPFAANVVHFAWAPFAPEVLEAVIEAGAPAVTISFGDPTEPIRRCRQAGVLTIVQVQELGWARRALDEAVDLLVVQGNEAGGHTGQRGTLSFAAQVLDLAGETPIALAGGSAAGVAWPRPWPWAPPRSSSAPASRPASSTRTYSIRRPKLSPATARTPSSTRSPTSPTACRGPRGSVAVSSAMRSPSAGRAMATSSANSSPAEGRAGFARTLAEAGTSINWGGEASGLVERVQPAAEIVAEVVGEAERLLRAVPPLLA